MDLQVITPISMLREIKVLHIESTDVCQAACPLCARETDFEFDKLSQHHLTIDQIKDQLPENTLRQLDKIFMCGNYGDPAAGKYTTDIYQYLRTLNPNITLGMNSNGGLQNTSWWSNLGKLFHQSQDYVVFSIDGLENTNHVYRKNVSWQKLMENAAAFIAAGGSAHWDMLVYKHNQHQVDQAQELAREMKFKWFRAKVSKRPIINQLEFPVGWPKPDLAIGPIQCHALQEQSIYIDAQGRVSPCCWLGSRQNNFVTDFDEVQASWNTKNPNLVCKSACSTQLNKTNFSLQWQKEIQLN